MGDFFVGDFFCGGLFEKSPPHPSKTFWNKKEKRDVTIPRYGKNRNLFLQGTFEKVPHTPKTFGIKKRIKGMLPSPAMAKTTTKEISLLFLTENCGHKKSVENLFSLPIFVMMILVIIHNDLHAK